jgi:hypothetical protein
MARSALPCSREHEEMGRLARVRLQIFFRSPRDPLLLSSNPPSVLPPLSLSLPLVCVFTLNCEPLSCSSPSAVSESLPTLLAVIAVGNSNLRQNKTKQNKSKRANVKREPFCSSRSHAAALSLCVSMLPPLSSPVSASVVGRSIPISFWGRLGWGCPCWAMANVDVNRLRSGGWNRPLLTSRYLQQKIQRAARRHECRPTNQRECHHPRNNLRTNLDLQAPRPLNNKASRFRTYALQFFSFLFRVELEQMAGQRPCVSLSCVIRPKGSGTTHRIQDAGARARGPSVVAKLEEPKRTIQGEGEEAPAPVQ